MLVAVLALAGVIAGCSGNASGESEEGNTPQGTTAEETTEGAEGSDVIEGTEEDDTINGTEGDDTIDGGGANDEINGLAGADEIDGGEGNDTIRAGPYDADVDTIEGNEGDDTTLTFDLPAARDIVGCGAGNDDVVADSLDETAEDCEDVERVQETEPDLADGTYELVPDPSSECSLGRGTLTIGADPATGERGVGVELGEQQDTSGEFEACETRIDYETPVTAQGEPAEQETNRRSYKGKRPPQREIDEMMREAQSIEGQVAAPAEP